MAPGKDTERGVGSPKHNPALDQVLSKESFGVCLTGVYYMGQLGKESLRRTAAVGQAYVSSYVQPLQQQVTFWFLEIKAGSTSITPGPKAPLTRSLWLGLGVASALALIKDQGL